VNAVGVATRICDWEVNAGELEVEIWWLGRGGGVVLEKVLSEGDSEREARTTITEDEEEEMDGAIVIGGSWAPRGGRVDVVVVFAIVGVFCFGEMVP
jgi:hypothetical protein